jgi:hypothetical protein
VCRCGKLRRTALGAVIMAEPSPVSGLHVGILAVGVWIPIVIRRSFAEVFVIPILPAKTEHPESVVAGSDGVALRDHVALHAAAAEG